MSSKSAANVTGRQSTLALCWNQNETRPIPQRAQKRNNKQQRKVNKELIEGQQTLSVNNKGIWNMQETRQEMKEKLKQEFWGDRLKSKGDRVIRIATKISKVSA